MRLASMKKLLALLLLLTCVLSGVLATTGRVTWSWFENDPRVSYYRYQVDGELDDNWTVVDYSVNEASFELDISVIHTLYLQQSYDGVQWSESSHVDSEIFVEDTFVPEEDYFYDEEYIYIEGEELPAETTEEEVEEVVEEQVVEEPKYKAQINLDYGFGYMNSIPNSAGPKTLGVFGSFSRTFTSVGAFEFGVKTNLAVYTSKNLFFDVQNTQLYTYLNAMAMVTKLVASSDIYLAIGPEIGAGLVTENSFHAGIALEFGVRYHRSERFTIGFALSDHYYLVPVSDIQNWFDVRVFLSTVF